MSNLKQFYLNLYGNFGAVFKISRDLYFLKSFRVMSENSSQSGSLIKAF